MSNTNIFGASELISISSLTASSTDPMGSNCYGGTCGVDEVKQTSANDQSNHLTNWQSALDPSCGPQSIKADWYGSAGYNSITSFSVLNGKLATPGGPSKVVLQTAYGDVDITSYKLCTSANVNDGGSQVEWDICALSSQAPAGTFDNVRGATFYFSPASVGTTGCVMNVYEIQMHGTPTPGASQPGLSAGFTATIVIFCLILLCGLGVWLVRQRNIRKRQRTGRFMPVNESEYLFENSN
ncbi:hypothetical protein HDU98_008015 [Podochytrium sp. JEL0797]|nr:hypothetical protein HDU98_008015 [Podochytrium sp. JEL0797]